MDQCLSQPFIGFFAVFLRRDLYLQGGVWPDSLLEDIMERREQGGYDLALKSLCAVFTATSLPTAPQPESQATASGQIPLRYLSSMLLLPNKVTRHLEQSESRYWQTQSIGPSRQQSWWYLNSLGCC